MERDPDTFRSPRQKPSRAVAFPYWELLETVKAMERCLARPVHQIVDMVSLHPVSSKNMVQGGCGAEDTSRSRTKVPQSSVNGTTRSEIAEQLLGMRASLRQQKCASTGAGVQLTSEYIE